MVTLHDDAWMPSIGWWSAKRCKKKLMKIVWTLKWKLSDENFTIKRAGV